MAFGNNFNGNYGGGGPQAFQRPMGNGGFLGRMPQQGPQQIPNMYGQPQQLPMDPNMLGEELDPSVMQEGYPQNPMMPSPFGGIKRPLGMGRAGFGGKLRPQFRNMGRFGNLRPQQGQMPGMPGQMPGQMPQQLPGQMAQNRPMPGRRPLPRPGGGNMPGNQGGGYL